MPKQTLKQLSARAVVGALVLACAYAPAAVESAGPAAAPPIRLAVFEFSVSDRSAGGGIIAVDEKDLAYVRQATDEARRLLAASGRYAVIDTSGVPASDLAGCDRCEGPLAERLGAEQAMTGLITRITRTEYTIRLRVIDAATNETLSEGSTGLRMGANYAWPRGVKWLLDQKLRSQD